MREIKFRVWDKSAKQFHYWGIFGDMFKGIPTINRLGLTEAMKLTEQYTGLKDKNGKEIYEGDILTWCINNIVKIGSVYYDEFQACFWMGKDKTTGFLVLNDWMRGGYEIIGNIHE